MTEYLGTLNVSPEVPYDGPLAGRLGPVWTYPPTGPEVLEALGEPTTDTLRVNMASATVLLVQRAAQGYTRGRGFRSVQSEAIPEVADDIAGVITTATMRLLHNPTSARRIEAGNFSTVPGSFEGWTTTELAVLRRYRRTSA